MRASSIRNGFGFSLLAAGAATTVVLAVACSSTKDDDFVYALGNPAHDAATTDTTLDGATTEDGGDAAVGDDAGDGGEGGADGGVDAATVRGELVLLETAVLAPGNAGAFLGQGREVAIGFGSRAETGAPTLEEQPGAALGCKAWVSTPAQAEAADIGRNEGAVAFTIPAPPIPACSHTARGYECPFMATQSTGGAIGLGPTAGTATLTDLDVTFNANNTSGAFVRIAGAENAANNGLFPIVGLAGADTIVYANAASVVEVLPVAANHVNLAGAGFIPDAADPGFLADGDALTFTLTPGGANDLAAFNLVTGAGGVGDDFTLVVGELAKLNALPNDGTAFTITCDAAGCPAGGADTTILEIVTTNAVVAGLSTYAMPLGNTNRARIRCVAPGATTAITVPAAYSAVLMNTPHTRASATFMRVNTLGGGPVDVTGRAGHAIRGFTTR